MGKDNWNFNLPLFVSSIHAGLHFVITACLMHFFPDDFDATRSGKGGRINMHSYVTQVVRDMTVHARAHAFRSRGGRKRRRIAQNGAVMSHQASFMYPFRRLLGVITGNTTQWVIVHV
jgi:hypothetical protein